MESKLSESDLTPAVNKKLVTVQSFHWLNNHQELAVVYYVYQFPETIIFPAQDFRDWSYGREKWGNVEHDIKDYLIERLNLRAVAEVERLKRVIENMKREAEEALNEINHN